MRNGPSSSIRTRMSYVYGICVRDYVDGVWTKSNSVRSSGQTLTNETIALILWIPTLKIEDDDTNEDDTKE